MFFAGTTPVLILFPNAQPKLLVLPNTPSSVLMAIALSIPLNARHPKPVLLTDLLDVAQVNAENYLMNVQPKKHVLSLTRSNVLMALVLPMWRAVSSKLKILNALQDLSDVVTAVVQSPKPDAPLFPLVFPAKSVAGTWDVLIP